ncbi:Hsp33 family molecular chaperone HslO [Oceanobacter kriegii]|uniref:Hsp33 family molecular chaperone HslO n=1 Tax=Oceanobacter kriegii TaxID=64972 RepID=UPI0004134F06|nr:Hsp33 family molecular chaperone HslO [Oceanobacter kriegii]
MTQTSADQLQRFSFDDVAIRGEVAHLNQAYQDVLSRHQYPQPIAVAVGKLMAATAMLSANLKFKGRLTLQIRLPGNISLIQAETDEQGQLRAIARYDENQPSEELSFEDGQMVITIEPDQGQRYQGITLIEGGDVAAALEEYFVQSEQLASRFWLMCDGQQAAGFMLQQLPSKRTDDDIDAWDRVSHLAATIKQQELLELANEELLHRLYHEENVRVYPASSLSFHCTCSRDRLANALHQVGKTAISEMIEESGHIDVNCEFCQQHYRFDETDMSELFPENNLH